MHRNADGTGLIGNGTRDGLTDPPGRIGRELESLAIVKLLHRLDQTEVALLDQIQKQHAPSDILLGNRYDKTQVRRNQEIPRRLITFFDALGNARLILRLQKRNAADFLQVHLDRITKSNGSAAGIVSRRNQAAHIGRCLFYRRRRIILFLIGIILIRFVAVSFIHLLRIFIRVRKIFIENRSLFIPVIQAEVLIFKHVHPLFVEPVPQPVHGFIIHINVFQGIDDITLIKNTVLFIDSLEIFFQLIEGLQDLFLSLIAVRINDGCFGDSNFLFF